MISDVFLPTAKSQQPTIRELIFEGEDSL